MSAPAEEPHVTIKSIDEAIAENAANRGPANRYRPIAVASFGPDDEAVDDGVEDDEDDLDWLVVSEAYTALDVMTGNAEVYAICETMETATVVSEALNKHFAN